MAEVSFHSPQLLRQCQYRGLLCFRYELHGLESILVDLKVGLLQKHCQMFVLCLNAG